LCRDLKSRTSSSCIKKITLTRIFLSVQNTHEDWQSWLKHLCALYQVVKPGSTALSQWCHCRFLPNSV
jgi:hypothetical protein